VPAPISTVPQGLLDLLNLKSQGETPSALVPSVQPTLDMFKFYLSQARETETATVNVAAAISDGTYSMGFTTPVIPSNQIWWIWSVTGRVQVNNGAVIHGGARIWYAPTSAAGNITLALTPWSITAPAAASAELYVGAGVNRFLQQAGQFWISLGRLQRAAATAAFGELTVEYTPLNL